MSQIPIDWIAFFLFLILFVAVIPAEVLWLVRKGWATLGKSIAYVLVTDLLSFGIGSSVVLGLVFLMFMLVMGPAGTGSNVPESVYVATTIMAIIFPPVFLILIKRVFLLIFKMSSGKAAWIYSILISLLKIAAVLLPPAVVYFGFVYLASWK
jgi:hypothetical protein